MLKKCMLIAGSVFLAGQMAFAKGNKGSIYHDGWIDFNKNGKMDVFENPKQPIEKRVQDLLSQMNLDEKTCQLATLYGYKRVMSDSLPTPEWKNKIWKDGIANIDEQLNGVGRGAKIAQDLIYPFQQTCRGNQQNPKMVYRRDSSRYSGRFFQRNNPRTQSYKSDSPARTYRHRKYMERTFGLQSRINCGKRSQSSRIYQHICTDIRHCQRSPLGTCS